MNVIGTQGVVLIWGLFMTTIRPESLRLVLHAHVIRSTGTTLHLHGHCKVAQTAFGRNGELYDRAISQTARL